MMTRPAVFDSSPYQKQGSEGGAGALRTVGAGAARHFVHGCHITMSVDRLFPRPLLSERRRGLR